MIVRLCPTKIGPGGWVWAGIQPSPVKRHLLHSHKTALRVSLDPASGLLSSWDLAWHLILGHNHFFSFPENSSSPGQLGLWWGMEKLPCKCIPSSWTLHSRACPGLIWNLKSHLSPAPRVRSKSWADLKVKWPVSLALRQFLKVSPHRKLCSPQCRGYLRMVPPAAPPLP